MNRDEAVAAVHDANNDRAMMYLAMYRELLSLTNRGKSNY